MKALFILYPQHVSKYNEYRNTGGYRFLKTVNTDDEVWHEVNEREDVYSDVFGAFKDANGRTVWEHGYKSFDFLDYQYITFDLAKLQPNDYGSHGNMWTAIQIEKPWNMDEIQEIVNA